MASNRDVLSVDVKFDGSTKVGNRELKDGAYLRTLQVDQTLDSPDYFSISIQMASHTDFSLLDDLKPGMEVEILLGYESEASVFKGEISYIEPSFSADLHEVTVSGYDMTHRLTRGTSSRTWGDGHEQSVDTGSVAGDIISKSKARQGETSDSLSGATDSSESKYEYIPQIAVNDYVFLKGIGVAYGVAMDSKSADSAKELSFKKPDASASPRVTICRETREPPGSSRLSLSADFTLSTVQQVAKVEVRAWDPVKKEAILGTAEAVSSVIDGTDGPSQAGTAHYGSGSTGRVVTIVDSPVASKDEADALAAAIFDTYAMGFCKANVVIEGWPELTAGDVVELKQFGVRYSGKYLVESAQHLVRAGAKEPYVVRLKLSRNSSPEPKPGKGATE
jgi:phage protein D